MEVWKIIFLSKWVICMFQLLIFQGVFSFALFWAHFQVPAVSFQGWWITEPCSEAMHNEALAQFLRQESGENSG